MKSFKLFAGKDRREKHDPRIIWVTEDCDLIEQLPEDRRKDADVLHALASLVRATNEREIAGIVFATVRRDGLMDLAAAGFTYDHPMMATALASRLRAMLDAWPAHPGWGKIPGEDD